VARSAARLSQSLKYEASFPPTRSLEAVKISEHLKHNIDANPSRKPAKAELMLQDK
jgi:hypothetical protein